MQAIKISSLTAAVKRQARIFYTVSDYHNWTVHIITGERGLISLIKRCQEVGIKLNVDVLLQAWYLHDTFHSISHQCFYGLYSQAIRSNEEFSAEHARYWLMNKMHSSEMHAQAVYDTIIATHPAIKPITPEQILIRAADIQTVAGPYLAFERNWEKLRREAENICGTRISAKEWALQTSTNMALYLWYDLHLTPQHDNERGASMFHEQAIKNILRKLNLIFGRGRLPVVAEVGIEAELLANYTSYGKKKPCVYIGIRSDMAKDFPSVFSPDRGAKKDYFQFVIPGAFDALPLKNKTVDVLILHRQVNISEATRVLKYSGRLIIRCQKNIQTNKSLSNIVQAEAGMRLDKELVAKVGEYTTLEFKFQ